VIKYISGHPEAYSLPQSLGFITFAEKLLWPCQVNDLKIELWQQEVRTVISKSSNLLSSLPVSKRSVPQTAESMYSTREGVCKHCILRHIFGLSLFLSRIWFCHCDHSQQNFLQPFIYSLLMGSKYRPKEMKMS